MAGPCLPAGTFLKILGAEYFPKTQIASPLAICDSVSINGIKTRLRKRRQHHATEPLCDSPSPHPLRFEDCPWKLGPPSPKGRGEKSTVLNGRAPSETLVEVRLKYHRQSRTFRLSRAPQDLRQGREGTRRNTPPETDQRLAQASRQ